MRNSMITVIATLSLIVAVPAHAAGKSSKQEQIGASSGAIVGAVTGGPIGFIVGAAIGAKIGDNAHKKNERIDGLQASLAASDGEVKVLRSDITSLTGEIDRLQDFARPELVSLMQAGIAMDLLFRTDEAVLADATETRLAALAGTIATMPDIRVQLDGFADERGDAAYNQTLSEERVRFVREQFVAAGVSPARISFAAHGESPALDDSPDSFALERRVAVTLFIDDAPSLASNPE